MIVNCQYVNNGDICEAVTIGASRNNGGFIEYRIRITKAPRGNNNPNIATGFCRWVMPSELAAPGFWKKTKTGAVESGKVSRSANEVWKRENLRAAYGAPA